MSDVGPYGTLQNPDADGVVADALVGERAGNVTAHQTSAAYSPATMSTAPYIPPATVIPPPPKPDPPPPEPEPEPEPVDEALCGHKGCQSVAVAGFRYCGRHTS